MSCVLNLPFSVETPVTTAVSPLTLTRMSDASIDSKVTSAASAMSAFLSLMLPSGPVHV
jgi:hypothetical protein